MAAWTGSSSVLCAPAYQCVINCISLIMLPKSNLIVCMNVQYSMYLWIYRMNRRVTKKGEIWLKRAEKSYVSSI